MEGSATYSYNISYFCLNGLEFPIRSDILAGSNFLAIPDSINSANMSLGSFLAVPLSPGNFFFFFLATLLNPKLISPSSNRSSSSDF